MGTDGLVVLIVLPIREVMLGLIRLFVIVDDLLVIVFRELLFDWLFKFLNKLEVLLNVLSLFRFELLGLMLLPIREVMLGLIRLFVIVDDLFVKVFRELLFDWLFKFLNKLEVLLDVLSLFRFELLGLMLLPMRDVMLELILLFVLLSERLIVLRLLMLFRLD